MAKGQIKQKQATIDKTQFEKLCALQCTRDEICAVLNVDDNTLIDWCKNTYGCDFRTIFTEKKQLGKMSLRRSQWKLAEKNPTMAIWLGKQYLGQKEQTTINNESIQRVQIINDLPKDDVDGTSQN